jgi:iron complex outermembrane recepter protein
MSLKDLMNVVVTPAKLPQARGEVTQKVDVITATDLESSVLGNRNLCEATARLPGASVCVLSRNDANWGAYGGIGPKYSTFMLGGIPIDAFVDPMSLDANAIERIEVQRGPASVFYPNYLSQDFAGNQSPLAGTVNLILKERINVRSTTFQGSLGSYNTLNAQIFHQNHSGSYHYFGGSSFERSDYTDYTIRGSWLNMTKPPEYRKTKVFGGLTVFPDEGEKQKFTIFWQHTWHTGDRGRVYEGFDHEYGTANMGYAVMLGGKLTFQSHIGFRTYDRSWQDCNASDSLLANEGVYQMIVPIDISFAWSHGREDVLSVGADYQAGDYSTWTDPLLGSHLYGNKSSARQVGIYAQEEWRPTTGFTVRGGMRFAQISNDITAVNGRTGAPIHDSWKRLLWNVGFRSTAGDRLSVFANAGSSFAVPALKSSAGTIPSSAKGVPGFDGQLPNLNLTVERGIAVDAGVDLDLPLAITLGVRGFHTTIRDAIVDVVVNQNPSQTQSINVESARCAGGELELSQELNEYVSWYGNLTYMESSIKNAEGGGANTVEIPFCPKSVFHVGAKLQTHFGLRIVAALDVNSGFYDGTSSDTRSFYKPGGVLNVHINQRISESDTYRLEGVIELYNVTANSFALPWQFKNPGFSGMAGVRALLR